MTSPENKPKLGVALSGGGARGLTHIGVLKVLSNSGTQIDYMAGTSMGGVIAACYAAGLEPPTIEKIACHVGKASNLLRLVDPTIPQKGMLKGDKVRKFFNKQLNNKNFEDLDIPLTLTAVDLNSNQEVHISEGNVADALRATVSIPGVFLPVEHAGMRLVDGGLLNNLPVDIVRDMGADVILGVDVGWCGNLKEDVFESTSGWVSKTPWVEMALTLYETINLFLSRQVEDKINTVKPDLLLQPKIPPKITSLTGYTNAAELIAIGEDCAQSIISDLHRLLQSNRSENQVVRKFFKK